MRYKMPISKNVGEKVLVIIYDQVDEDYES